MLGPHNFLTWVGAAGISSLKMKTKKKKKKKMKTKNTMKKKWNWWMWVGRWLVSFLLIVCHVTICTTHKHWEEKK